MTAISLMRLILPRFLKVEPFKNWVSNWRISTCERWISKWFSDEAAFRRTCWAKYCKSWYRTSCTHPWALKSTEKQVRSPLHQQVNERALCPRNSLISWLLPQKLEHPFVELAFLLFVSIYILIRVKVAKCPVFISIILRDDDVALVEHADGLRVVHHLLYDFWLCESRMDRGWALT